MVTENKTLIEHLSIAEFANDLYSVSENLSDRRLKYYQLQAKAVGSDYFYCFNSELEKHKVPFVYIFDFRNKQVEENELASINRSIWTIGEIALAVVVYLDDIKIIDTRQPVIITENGTLEANFLFPLIKKIDSKLREQIFNGRIIENPEKDYLAISPYVQLLEHIDKNILSKEVSIGCSPTVLRKLVVKCILIKYLEEQIDDNGENIFKNNFFSTYIPNQKITSPKFCDVLNQGDIPLLFDHLNKKFNGGVFELSKIEEKEIVNSNLSTIAVALDGRFEVSGQGSLWQLYDFRLLPIEFISRLYERFILTVDGRQKKDGAYYTPPHLARLLVDELLPFDDDIDFEDFKVADPACGSGIFLVLVYKRLITLWMLQNNKDKIEGIEDINNLRNILTKCIYGTDINNDAISITATSLQIEFTSHFLPKDIEIIQFENLIEKGNLSHSGFFKWYKSSNYKFNIIVGNPPFNIDKKDNVDNKEKGIDDICDNEVYFDENNKKQHFPYKNPALTFLYKSLEKLLKPNGSLFMIMPSSAFLYNPTSLAFRKTVFQKWKTQKIYDFTPLKNYLWGKTKIATVAVLIKNEINDNNPIEHIVVRSSFANEKGASRFQVDKYDRFTVTIDKAIRNKYEWKTNLLGGGRLHFYTNKYLSGNQFVKYDQFVKKWLKSTGFRQDKSSNNQVDLKGMKLLKTTDFISDNIENSIYTCNQSIIKRNIEREILSPPNILIRLNANYSMPIVLNKDEIGFFPGVLCLKGDSLPLMQQFVKLFRSNRPIYKTLIKLLSSKIYMQQSGEYTIDAQDIMNLPINIDIQGNPVPFEKMSNIELTVWEDTELLAQSINKTTGPIFGNTTISQLEQYNSAFCDIINYVYEDNNFKFRPTRIIINENWVWITFKHTNLDRKIENEVSIENEVIFNQIIKDEVSNNGLRINRVISYLNEPNSISFLKPRAFKYWMRTIGYRDAEEVKSTMFNNGF